jgi:hypothetical protein
VRGYPRIKRHFHGRGKWQTAFLSVAKLFSWLQIRICYASREGFLCRQFLVYSIHWLQSRVQSPPGLFSFVVSFEVKPAAGLVPERRCSIRFTDFPCGATSYSDTTMDSMRVVFLDAKVIASSSRREWPRSGPSVLGLRKETAVRIQSHTSYACTNLCSQASRSASLILIANEVEVNLLRKGKLLSQDELFYRRSLGILAFLHLHEDRRNIKRCKGRLSYYEYKIVQ